MSIPYVVKRFDSVDEFLIASEPCAHRLGNSLDWYNNESVDQSINFTRYGNDAIVSEAEQLIEQLSDVNEGEAIETWQPSFTGAYPVIPEFIAGHPLNMRMKLPSSEVSPVNIYVCTTSSGGISSEQYMKRGAAILALVMKLQKARPVNLFVSFECDGGDFSRAAIHIIPIQSQPLNISQAAYVLSSTGFSRHLTYGYAAAHQGSNLGWVPGHNRRGLEKPKEYLDMIREAYGLTPTDLHIPPINLRDPLFTKPVEWINTQLARYNGANQS